MRIAAVLFLLSISSAIAGEPNFHERANSALVWHSPSPVAHARYDGDKVPCYETIRREPNLTGELIEFRYSYECVEPAHSMSAIGLPLDHSPTNMSGVREATSVRITNGKIILE